MSIMLSMFGLIMSLQGKEVNSKMRVIDCLTRSPSVCDNSQARKRLMEAAFRVIAAYRTVVIQDSVKTFLASEVKGDRSFDPRESLELRAFERNMKIYALTRYLFDVSNERPVFVPVIRGLDMKWRGGAQLWPWEKENGGKLRLVGTPAGYSLRYPSALDDFMECSELYRRRM
jgi:hypothetical protein